MRSGCRSNSGSVVGGRVCDVGVVVAGASSGGMVGVVTVVCVSSGCRALFINHISLFIITAIYELHN